MPSKIELQRTRVLSILSVLSDASAQERERNVSITLAKNFNSIVDEVAEEYPDLKEALPPHILSRGNHRHFDRSDVSYIDLEIFAKQLREILNQVSDQ